MKIYTKTGDDGSTGVYGGGRLLKCDLRIAAYGTVDELNSHIGVVRAHLGGSDDRTGAELLKLVDEHLATIQHHLFALGAELATIDPDKNGTRWNTDEPIVSLERLIDQLEAVLPPLKSFILPGGCLIAAQLHVARTVCRRSERDLLGFVLTEMDSSDKSVQASEPLVAPKKNSSQHLIRYLNRLSDLLFVMARYVNHVSGVPDVLWCKD